MLVCPFSTSMKGEAPVLRKYLTLLFWFVHVLRGGSVARISLHRIGLHCLHTMHCCVCFFCSVGNCALGQGSGAHLHTGALGLAIRWKRVSWQHPLHQKRRPFLDRLVSGVDWMSHYCFWGHDVHGLAMLPTELWNLSLLQKSNSMYASTKIYKLRNIFSFWHFSMLGRHLSTGKWWNSSGKMDVLGSQIQSKLVVTDHEQSNSSTIETDLPEWTRKGCFSSLQKSI